MISLLEIVKKIPLSDVERMNYMFISGNIDADYVLSFVYEKLKAKQYDFLKANDEFSKLFRLAKFDSSYCTITDFYDLAVVLKSYDNVEKLFYKMKKVKNFYFVISEIKRAINILETKKFKVMTIKFGESLEQWYSPNYIVICEK